MPRVARARPVTKNSCAKRFDPYRRPECDRPFTVLVTGSRYWCDMPTIEQALLELVGERTLHEVLLVHGGCDGADRQAESVACKHGWLRKTYYAAWSKEGRDDFEAGPKRNALMVADSRPHAALVCMTADRCAGTRDCEKRLREYKATVYSSLKVIKVISSEHTGTDESTSWLKDVGLANG
jgi:hypothetical protein